ncbi:PTS sugar transporter subunit IIB [Microbacterium tumbae]
MRILVVCGAGASSTFVAQRLRRAALAVGLDWDASAGTEQSILSVAHDLVLVGPHLVERLAAIRELTRAPALPLPEDVFSDRDGERTLALVRSALASGPISEKGTS